MHIIKANKYTQRVMIFSVRTWMKLWRPGLGWVTDLACRCHSRYTFSIPEPSLSHFTHSFFPVSFHYFLPFCSHNFLLPYALTLFLPDPSSLVHPQHFLTFFLPSPLSHYPPYILPLPDPLTLSFLTLPSFPRTLSLLLPHHISTSFYRYAFGFMWLLIRYYKNKRLG